VYQEMWENIYRLVRDVSGVIKIPWRDVWPFQEFLHLNNNDNNNNNNIIIIIIIIIYINNFYFNIFDRCDLFLLPACAFLLRIILECILHMFAVPSP
jgi:hypothetical protein